MTTVRLIPTKLVVEDLESIRNFYCGAYRFSDPEGHVIENIESPPQPSPRRGAMD